MKFPENWTHSSHWHLVNNPQSVDANESYISQLSLRSSSTNRNEILLGFPNSFGFLLEHPCPQPKQLVETFVSELAFMFYQFHVHVQCFHPVPIRKSTGTAEHTCEKLHVCMLRPAVGGSVKSWNHDLCSRVPIIFSPYILSFFYQEKGESFRFSFSLSSVDPSNFVKHL